MTKLTRSRFLRQFVLGALSLCCVIIFAACGSGNTSSSSSPASSSGASSSAGGATLKVATDATFAPFEYQEGGKIVGFDVDLINAIGKEAGFTPQIQNLNFDGIIPGLQAGTVDVGLSSITITKERAQTIGFSHPYFKAGLAIAVQNNNNSITKLDDLKDKKIAVQIGTTGAAKAKTISGTQVRTFDTSVLALQELANGNVDAVINDAPNTLYALKSGGVSGVKVVGQLLTEEYYGIATPKDSPNLDKINKGLAAVIQNGTYASIYKKWFGGEAPKLPEAAPGV
jgi:arginine/lysine/histidine/glutamine transport system substrate-binding and permease protein